MSDETKFCKDCKWLQPTGMDWRVRCEHSDAVVVDLVTGEPRHMDPQAMRIRICGPEGKLWEPKEPKVMPRREDLSGVTDLMRGGSK